MTDSQQQFAAALVEAAEKLTAAALAIQERPS